MKITDPLTIVKIALRLTGSATIGDLMAYCRQHDTTPTRLVEEADQ